MSDRLGYCSVITTEVSSNVGQDEANSAHSLEVAMNDVVRMEEAQPI